MRGSLALGKSIGATPVGEEHGAVARGEHHQNMEEHSLMRRATRLVDEIGSTSVHVIVPLGASRRVCWDRGGGPALFHLGREFRAESARADLAHDDTLALRVEDVEHLGAIPGTVEEDDKCDTGNDDHGSLFVSWKKINTRD